MSGRKKDKEPNRPGEHWTDKAAGKLAGAGMRLQQKFADCMHQQFSGLPPKKLKLVLLLFCLLSGGFSLYLAVFAVVGEQRQQPAFQVQPVPVPRHYDRTGSEVNETGSYVDEFLYREIQEYKRYMDSSGLPIRPGLADSIRLLEQIFHSQPYK